MFPSATSASSNPSRNGDSSWGTQEYTELLWKHVIVVTKNPHQHRGTFPVLTQTSCCPFYPAQGPQIPVPAQKAMAESRTCTSHCQVMLQQERICRGKRCELSSQFQGFYVWWAAVGSRNQNQASCSRTTQQHRQSWDDWDTHFQQVLQVWASTDGSALIKPQEFHLSLLFPGGTRNMGNFSPAEIGTESQLSQASAINGTIFPHKMGQMLQK